MKIGNRERDHQYAPRSKFVQQMRQIKIKWLRAMNRFAKAPDEFVHHDFIEKPRLKKNSTNHPKKKDAQRRKPRPPAAPDAVSRRARRSRPTAPLKEEDAREQEGVNNRALDQHCDREQCKDVNSISPFPRLLLLN